MWAVLIRYYEGMRLIDDTRGCRWERIPRCCTWCQEPSEKAAHETAAKLQQGGLRTVVCPWDQRYLHLDYFVWERG